MLAMVLTLTISAPLPVDRVCDVQMLQFGMPFYYGTEKYVVITVSDEFVHLCRWDRYDNEKDEYPCTVFLKHSIFITTYLRNEKNWKYHHWLMMNRYRHPKPGN